MIRIKTIRRQRRKLATVVPLRQWVQHQPQDVQDLFNAHKRDAQKSRTKKPRPVRAPSVTKTAPARKTRGRDQ